MTTPVLNLTFIEEEQRRVQVAEDMALVYDSKANGGVHWRWDHLCETYTDPVCRASSTAGFVQGGG